jgi:hypothetical protein
MNFQLELRQPLLKLLQQPLGVRPELEARHEIVRVPDHVSRCHFPRQTSAHKSKT